VRTIKKSARLSTTEYAVLGLLTHGERSGYELQRRAAAGVGYVWTGAKTQVYTVLPRLVDGGFSTARVVRQERLPDKQVYRITAKGRRELVSWLEEPMDDYLGPRSPFLLKVFLGRLMRPDALVAHVAGMRSYLAGLLEELEEIEREIADDPDDYYGYLTLRWGLIRGRASLAWADEVLAELEERR
jgi:DNA-binding PadR family transcriptional regulator